MLLKRSKLCAIKFLRKWRHFSEPYYDHIHFKAPRKEFYFFWFGLVFCNRTEQVCVVGTFSCGFAGADLLEENRNFRGFVAPFQFAFVTLTFA
ncbi:hypothetical protein POTOM_011221 [Populus tomentosa]|uniref:Uncharacterized protein n=1 Tax=Populus tomentosa TaxID=118781 RepID=A0A8X8A9F5_POPTO|nr:hypothetical protein POTOM_011221 [Populus tomentosa]